jgi:hypothetical protein
MSTDQEYWDAILIRTWRQFGSLKDAIVMFRDTVGKRVLECNLLRFPNTGMPWTIGVRVFAADYLPKINDWLLEHPKEQDVNLLRKLKDAKYTTLRLPMQRSGGQGYEAAHKSVHNNEKRVLVGMESYYRRNEATDWNKTKGPAKIRRVR